MRYGSSKLKQKMKKQGIEDVRWQRGMFAPLVPADDEPTDTQSKADARAEADALVAQFRGRVTKLPTYIDLKCVCGRRARVAVQPGARPRFRCKRCGVRQ